MHRDVKPANVLVPESGPVKVTDFGIAKAIGTDDLTRTGTVMGTARYLSPEQVNGHATDARTDVYGLGLLLFEMLCGHPPFGGDTEIATAMARLTTSAPSVRADRPDAPAALDDIVHRCLARAPDARYESARGVHDALARLRAPQRARSTATSRLRSPSPRPAASTTAASDGSARARTASSGRAPAPVPAAKRKGSGWIWVVLALVVVLGLAAAAVYLGTTRRLDPAARARPNAATGGQPVDRRRVGVRPLRRRPGGRRSTPAQAVDGDPATAWSTEQYNDPLEHTKKGVGLRIDLERRDGDQRP